MSTCPSIRSRSCHAPVRPAARAGIAGTASRSNETAIDQLRVALSRATETLAFVDVAGDEDAHVLSADLLEDAAPYHADDLVEHLDAVDRDDRCDRGPATSH